MAAVIIGVDTETGAIKCSGDVIVASSVFAKPVRNLNDGFGICNRPLIKSDWHVERIVETSNQWQRSHANRIRLKTFSDLSPAIPRQHPDLVAKLTK